VGLMEQVEDEQMAGKPPVGLMEQVGGEQSAGTPPVGLVEDEQSAGDLAVGLAGTGALSRALQSLSQCKMTQSPNPPNLSRS
jgi:hypothetical protein